MEKEVARHSAQAAKIDTALTHGFFLLSLRVVFRIVTKEVSLKDVPPNILYTYKFGQKGIGLLEDKRNGNVLVIKFLPLGFSFSKVPSKLQLLKRRIPAERKATGA